MSRDRVLVEDGEIAYDIASAAIGGEYRREDRIVCGNVRLVPAADHEPRFFVDDRATGDELGVINAGAVATARQLVATIEAVAEAAEVDR